MTNKYPSVSIREVATLLDVPRDAIVNAIAHGNIQPSGKGPRGHDVYPLNEILKPLYKRRGELDPASLSPSDRKNLADALLKEHDLQVKSANFLPRDAYRSATAEAYARCASSIRSIPDNLERRLGLTPEQSEYAEEVIDSILGSLYTDMKATHEKANAALAA